MRGAKEPELSEEDLAMVDVSGATEEETEEIVGVPDFWLSALGRHEAFEYFLQEPDIAALKFLVDVRAVDADDLTGFRLEFHFAPNPHFKNEVLTKAYTIPNLVTANGQPELERIEGCEIEWHTPNDCLVQHEIKRKQKAKKGSKLGQSRV